MATRERPELEAPAAAAGPTAWRRADAAIPPARRVASGGRVQRSSPPERIGALADATPAGGLIVEDEAQTVGSGQLRKSEFMRLLRLEVSRVTDEELAAIGRTSDGCPYLAQMLAYYEGRPAAHVEGALRRYAPEARGAGDARDYLAPLGARLGRGVARWVTTGRMPDDAPDAIAMTMTDGGGWVDEVKAWTFTQRVIGVYTLIYEATAWEEAHETKIQLTGFMRAMLRGDMAEIFGKIVRGESLSLMDQLNAAAAAGSAPK